MQTPRRAPFRSVGTLCAAVLLAGCATAYAEQDDGVGVAVPGSAGRADAPALAVEVLADELDHPWDVAQAPDGTLLVDERAGRLTAVLPDGDVREVRADLDDLYVNGETGLLGLVLDPAFAENRRFYLCQGVRDGEDGDPSVAVRAWTVTEDWSTATRVGGPVVGDIPANPESGMHSGCRLRFDAEGALLIGTGDNAVGTRPQNLDSLAGKVLRVDAPTGRPAAGNPFADRSDPDSAFIWTYGHRNIQGLAVRPSDGAVFEVEHGTFRDDEVNLLRGGGNYGWNPDGEDGTYDQSVPMTDPDLPGAVPAVWSSGDPTIAPSGATFLDGPQWGDYEGLLLLGLLKDQGVLALRLDAEGAVVDQFRLPELDRSYGRIRAVQQGADGALYVTTDNGNDDQLLRVTPG